MPAAALNVRFPPENANLDGWACAAVRRQLPLTSWESPGLVIIIPWTTMCRRVLVEVGAINTWFLQRLLPLIVAAATVGATWLPDFLLTPAIGIDTTFLP
jgi:hypothetical protein